MAEASPCSAAWGSSWRSRGIIFRMAIQNDISTKINALLTDERFLRLSAMRGRPNLFEAVAASRTEMWHSAFVGWVLDPESHLGLGVFPLKRFLYALVKEGRRSGGVGLHQGYQGGMRRVDHKGASPAAFSARPGSNPSHPLLPMTRPLPKQKCTSGPGQQEPPSAYLGEVVG